MCSAKTVILTRPERAARQFANAMHAAGILNPTIIAPLRDIIDHDTRFAIDPDEHALISSAEAARIAGARLQNRRVLAIGAGTAAMAESYGATIDHISLNAAAMLDFLRADPPARLHILRGEPFTFEPETAFMGLPIKWRASLLYHATDAQWTAALKSQISALDSVVFPLFSAGSWPALARAIGSLPEAANVKILPISQKLADKIAPILSSMDRHITCLNPPQYPDRAGMLMALHAILTV